MDLFGILRKKGVNGFSASYQRKIRSSMATNIQSIRIYVEKKSSRWRIFPWNWVPKKINGIPTDVVEIGKIKALAVDRTKRFDPIPAGVSVGEEHITAGTKTMSFSDKTDGKTVDGSNSHVFNGYGAPIGSRIYQPGPYDGGQPEDTYATLKRAVPINFGGISECPVARIWINIYNLFAKWFGASTRLEAVVSSRGLENEVDFAIAELTGARQVVPGVLLEDGSIHIPKQIDEVQVGDVVWKCGRTSGYTEGPVIDTNATLSVSYGVEGTAIFVHQALIAGELLEPGDSGSPIFAKIDGDWVLLGFAGSNQVGVANHAKRVAELGQIELLE